MRLADFYLICFVVGLSLSFLSFVFGALHLHVPLKWHAHGTGGHAHANGTPGGKSASQGKAFSWLNAPTLFAFLAWFGGTGYLLTEYY